MVNTKTISFLNNKAVTAKQINETLSDLRDRYNELHNAIYDLCTKRKCPSDVESSGDTTPIKLLKAERANTEYDIKNIENKLYISIEQVIEILETFNNTEDILSFDDLENL